MKRNIFVAAVSLITLLGCKDGSDPLTPVTHPDIAGVWGITLPPASISLQNPDTTIALASDTTKVKVTLTAADSTFQYVSQLRMGDAYVDAFTAAGTWSVLSGDSLVEFTVESAASMAGPIPTSAFSACGSTVTLKLLSSTLLMTSMGMNKSIYCMMGLGDAIELIESDPVVGPVIMGYQQALTRVP